MKDRFMNAYKKVVVDEGMVKGTVAGVVLSRMINREISNLELIGAGAAVHLIVSAITTAASIAIDVDEHFDED